MTKTARLISNSLYRQIVKHLPICTVDILLFSTNKKQVLLFRRHNQPAKATWYTLGGRLRKNELLLSAARRVARSEANIRLARTQLTFGGVIDEIFSNSRYKDVTAHNVNIFFSATISQKHLTAVFLDSQHTSMRWWSVKNTKIHPYVRRKIQMARKFL